MTLFKIDHHSKKEEIYRDIMTAFNAAHKNEQKQAASPAPLFPQAAPP